MFQAIQRIHSHFLELYNFFLITDTTVDLVSRSLGFLFLIDGGCVPVRIPRSLDVRCFTTTFCRPRFVNRVQKTLVQIDEEYNIVSETRYPSHGRHFDDEAEQVINKLDNG